MIIEEKPVKNSNFEWWGDRCKKLLEDQKASWPLLKSNFEVLDKAEIKTIDFGKQFVRMQYLPEKFKIVQSDQPTVCSLCMKNLSKEQNGIYYDKNNIILCNPYPYLNEHFTIVKRKHTPQTLIGNFDEMLDLSQDLHKHYNIFYNGPKCGSSIPGHMNFVAGTKNSTPLESIMENLLTTEKQTLYKDTKIEIRFFDQYRPYLFIFESKYKGELLYAFKVLIKAFRKISIAKEEPMMNVVSSYINSKWRLIFFPRRSHKPNKLYLNEGGDLYVGPSSLDMAGLITLHDKEYFNNISKEEIENLYNEVSLTKEYYEFLKKKIGEIF